MASVAKRRGVVAVPGRFMYGDAEEIKTPKELQEVAKRQPSVWLTVGHPETVFPKTTDYVGKVFLRWDSDKLALAGEFSFYEDKLPPEMLNKLKSGETVGVSPGMLVDEILEDGTQKGMNWTHVAILDREDPRCPLGTCGVNVRMDTDLPEKPKNYRWDKTSELKSDEKPVEDKPEVVKETPAEEGFNPAQMEQLKGIVSEMVPKPSEPVNKDVEVTEVKQEPEPVQADVPEPEPVPEVLIPAAASSNESDGLPRDAFGRYEFIPEYAKKDKKKE